jgi:hypothetical protein
MTDTQAADLHAGARPDPGQPGPEAQARHAPAVLANRLLLAQTWGHPCLGYLLLFRPGPGPSAAFAALQDRVLAAEPGLLRQPGHALHSTVGFLIPVYRPVDRPKDEIWREAGARWLDVITAAVDSSGPLRLSFRRLVATDAAIIAVADAPNPVTSLRDTLTAGLGLPWPLAKGPLVHVSLFRYRQPLRDPAGLLACLAALDFSVQTGVDELLLVRETTYPSLDYEILHRLPIGRQPP